MILPLPVGIFILVLIALSMGAAVAAATIVVISVLGIVPHLASITGTKAYGTIYAYIMCLGVTLASLASLLQIPLSKGIVGNIIFFICEVFIGIFAGIYLCALAEILDIFPAIVANINLKYAAETVIITLAIGKAVGSLLYYLTPYFAF